MVVRTTAGERLLKIAQVARMANVSPRTVWRDIAAGRLKAVRQKLAHRHRVRVPLPEAQRYAAGKEATSVDNNAG